MTGIHPLDWTQEEFDNFGTKGQVTRHRYNELPLFDRQALVDLLDSYPRRHLQAFTMGDDPCRNEEWSCVDIDAASSGDDLMRAVMQGRLWLNVTHIGENSPDFAAIIASMYHDLSRHCPHLGNPQPNFSTLLISSPGAQVYYHLDAEPNMLWHMRGEKRIWIYPAMDTRFVPQEYIEDIFAGEIDENLPFDPTFDDKAEAYLLKPGDVASWPHNGPHRIVNIDLNVSLATSYYTPSIYKRQYVQLANRFLLRPLGINQRSMQEDGVMPAVKRMSFRAINKIRPFNRRNRSAGYLTDLQIDPEAPNGLRRLSAPRPPSFSVARDTS